MAEVATELKALRLYGMAAAWADLTAQGCVGIDASRWLIEHLLPAEHTDRAMRSVSYPLKAARCPCIAIWPASTSARRRSMSA